MIGWFAGFVLLQQGAQLWGGAEMGGISGQRGFAGCRAPGGRAATTPSASVAHRRKNEPSHLEPVFDSPSGRISLKRTSCPGNITRVESDIEELRWN
jgi:hypothetical protein